MRSYRSVLAWIATGIVAALFVGWVLPRAYPYLPREWQISKDEAEVIALERLRDLGDIPADPFVVTRQDEANSLEYRLNASLENVSQEEILSSQLFRNMQTWEVTVWEPAKRPSEWNYRARITPDGQVTELLLRVPADQEAESIAETDARERAQQFLQEQGIDLGNFDPPETRTRQLQARTDLFLRYRHQEALLGSEYPYGIEVVFAGDRLAGFSRYFDDPELAAVRDSFQPIQLLGPVKIFLPLVLVPLVAIPFVRRYHAGEIGTRRGLQIALLVVICGVVTMIFVSREASAGTSIGVLSRQQVNLVVAVYMVILFFSPMALMSFLSWSVGESLTRVKHGYRLAAFDALFKGDWKNSTFAQASLRGPVAGLAIVAVMWGLTAAARGLGVWAYGGFMIGPWWNSSGWFVFPLLGFGLAYSVYMGMFGALFLVSYWERWLGRWGSTLLAAAAAVVLFFASTLVHPFSWNILFWVIEPLAFILLFLRYGIFTSILANFTTFIVSNALPFVATDDASIQLQVSLALLAPAIPLILSARYLLSERKFIYRYEDVPPHVRRIAERERQRVELETARGIQASILPDLPPQLNGVKMTHRYLPATEVGGDFYDVLGLEDGRLAVAVGDVAGHGVSSGLVMSMTKSALAVQVTFDPDVKAVFSTLNRLVHQSARKRLLATLCYALIDPQRREMFYASAGHLFPYRLSVGGDVEALESVSYPLGVREEIDVRVRASRLESGDTLFMFSDGIVEARAEGSDEMFGFDRLEVSLSQHVGAGVEGVRDGVLADLENFTRNAPREDDLTVLVLQVP